MSPSPVGLPITCLVFVTGIWAQNSSNLSYNGTWRSEGEKSVKWVLGQPDDQIHVQELDGASTKADYTCNTVGKECEIKEEGHRARVSFWFNGPKLVELETRGDVVVKRRFEITDKGNTLEVETIPVAPAGKSEKLAFLHD